jgi:hypothetical protein
MAPGRIAGIAAFIVSLSLPVTASAAASPRWSLDQLAGFADVIVTGRVEGVSSAWDTQVSKIYTYVSVIVFDVMKGTAGRERIVIKQLGGTVGSVGLSIQDQAMFAPGEEVLLFLESRPRDRTLYTAALWQGKWIVESAPASGDRMAVQRVPDGRFSTEERYALSDIRIRTRDARGNQSAAVNTQPAETPADRVGGAFTLLGPYRFGHVPPVDMQAGGQPGLAGGGTMQILSAISRWNAAGSPFRFGIGTPNAPARCLSSTFGEGHVTISFMDPCGEISDEGGTLAIGGSYYSTDIIDTFAGQTYFRALEGFIINNNSSVALNYLSTPGCFEDIQTHELGHVLGLNHSADPSALMSASLNAQCVTAPRGLGPDDVAGLRWIYGESPVMPPSAAPTRLRVEFSGPQNLVVSWDPVVTQGVSAYRVQFWNGHQKSGGLVASVDTAWASLHIAIPAYVSGLFSVTVTVISAAGDGPSSPPRDFTIPGTAVSCVAPPTAVTDVAVFVGSGFARLHWSASPDATSYRLQAGSAPGAADFVGLTDIGNSTTISSAVPIGVRAWIRIHAANACGVSPPVDFFLQ